MNNLPALLMQAAHSAAVADGLIPNGAETNDSDDEDDATSSAAAALTMVANQAPQSVAARDLSAQEHAATALANKSAEVAAAQLAAASAASGKSTPSTTATAPKPTQKSATTSPAPSACMGKKKGPPLRRGKWTPEEEAYANRLIQEFKAGLLPLTDGTTLRTFLSKLLNCDPMRISKKFVGSNCIGKQVFRRRTADINRLTPEQIQASQQELSELERRFLERVAQTNRVKSSSASAGPPPANLSSASSAPIAANNQASRDDDTSAEAFSDPAAVARDSQTPPWLKPPTNLNFNRGNNRAAAIGRALLQDSGNAKGGIGTSAGHDFKSAKSPVAHGHSHGSAGLLALAEMQRRQNMHVSLLQNQQALQQLAALQKSASGSGLAALANNGGLSNTAMAQIARNASAARLAGIAASQSSMNNLMLKTGLSRDQLSQLARDGNFASTHSLSSMVERQSSFDALMSLDFQSLQSIDNLANLIQTGGGGGLQSHIPKTGIKNWNPLDASGFAAAAGSSGNLSSLASARRLASQGRMDSLIRSLSSGQGLSSGNIARNGPNSNPSGFNLGSNASFSNLLHNLSGNFSAVAAGGSTDNMQNFLGSNNPFSAISLANMLRVDSSTGLTALRMKDGLVQRNSSVDDFLSLVASGDIPHQDPHMLNVPLQSVMQQQGAVGNQTGAQAAATLLAQQQFLAQAAAGNGNNGTNALSEAIRASGGSSSFLNQWAQGSASATGAMAAALAQQQQSQLNAMAQAQQANGKRKLGVIDSDLNVQGGAKR